MSKGPIGIFGVEFETLTGRSIAGSFTLVVLAFAALTALHAINSALED